MSKVGLQPIEFDTAKITITVDKGGEFGNQVVKVKGSKGELEQPVRKNITVTVTDGVVTVERKNELPVTRGYHGLYRTLIQNMIVGVTDGYEKRLEIHGVGYRGAQKGNGLELNLGFSHQVTYDAPEGIEVKMEGQEEIIVTGIDKQKVGQVAAEIRALRKPEPYKGKGIRYKGEQIKRKAGKSNVAA